MPTRPYNGKFAGKHVVITGGSEGIGLSIGSELVSAGAHVTIMARSAEKLKKAQELLHLIAIDTKSGSKVSIEAMDVTVYDQVTPGQVLKPMSCARERPPLDGTDSLIQKAFSCKCDSPAAGANGDAFG